MGDIFSPAYCDRDFNYFNTQHDINNWFWKNIKKLNCDYAEFKATFTQFKNNSESHFAELDKVTTKINVDVADIYFKLKQLVEADKLMRSDFVAFTVEVNRTLDLYRSDINAINLIAVNHTERLNDYDSKIETLNTKFAVLKSKVDDYHFDDILEAFTTNERRFNVIAEGMSDQGANIRANRESIETEIITRQEKDTSFTNLIQRIRQDLNTQISSENSHFNQLKDKDDSQDISINELDEKIAENENKFNIYKALNEEEKAQIKTVIEENKNELNSKITDENNQRLLEDNKLNTKIETINGNLISRIDSEVTNREEADDRLNNKLISFNQTLTDTTNDLTTKYNNHNTIILNHSANINNLESDLSNEITQRKNKDQEIIDLIPNRNSWTNLIFHDTFTIDKELTITVPKLNLSLVFNRNNSLIDGYKLRFVNDMPEVKNIYAEGRQNYRNNNNSLGNTNFNFEMLGNGNFEVSNSLFLGNRNSNSMQLTLWYQFENGDDKFYLLKLFGYKNMQDQNENGKFILNISQIETN